MVPNEAGNSRETRETIAIGSGQAGTGLFRNILRGAMKKQSNQQGFTLMELMVVIVIVAILAAVAVPLYINYVRDAQRTEAKAAIGAIATAEQVYFQKSGGVNYIDDKTLETQGLLDIGEARSKWTIKVENYSSGQKFHVTATNIADPTLKVCYDFDRTTGGKFDDVCATTPPPPPSTP